LKLEELKVVTYELKLALTWPHGPAHALESTGLAFHQLVHSVTTVHAKI